MSVDPGPATISIVVPTYNERDRLTDLVDAVFAAYDEASIDGELIVVDDNSPDGTGALADSLAGRYRIKVLHRAGKLGLGTAVIEGFEAASAAIVGVIDADMSHPPSLLPKMLAAMHDAGADVVVGSRYIPGGGTRNWEKSRLLMSRIACLMARSLTPIRDATSGLFLIRRELARGVRISAGGFKICLELLVRSRPKAVVEVPYVFVGTDRGREQDEPQGGDGLPAPAAGSAGVRRQRASAPPVLPPGHRRRSEPARRRGETRPHQRLKSRLTRRQGGGPRPPSPTFTSVDEGLKTPAFRRIPHFGRALLDGWNGQTSRKRGTWLVPTKMSQGTR